MLTQKNVWRVLALLAAAVLIQASTGVTLVQADRDQAACVQACNAIRDICKNVCSDDCAALYPTTSTEYSVCNSACRQGCSDDSQECKAKCNIRKNPPHNGEP